MKDSDREAGAGEGKCEMFPIYDCEGMQEKLHDAKGDSVCQTGERNLSISNIRRQSSHACSDVTRAPSVVSAVLAKAEYSPCAEDLFRTSSAAVFLERHSPPSITLSIIGSRHSPADHSAPDQIRRLRCCQWYTPSEQLERRLSCVSTDLTARLPVKPLLLELITP